jgi:hypothetical protein
MGADLPESPGRIRDESANYPKTLPKVPGMLAFRGDPPKEIVSLDPAGAERAACHSAYDVAIPIKSPSL